MYVCRSKSDEKYTEVMNRIGGLLNVVSDRESHIQAQESIVVCCLNILAHSYLIFHLLDVNWNKEEC